MKKQLFTLCLLLASVITFAQTPRLSLYEEFTGETCPPCASTNPGLNAKLSSPTNTPLVVAIKWQVPIPSAPSNTWSLYQTNKTEINWRYKSAANSGYGYPSQDSPTGPITQGINYAPQGRLDGQHQWVFLPSAGSDHPTYVSDPMIAAAQSQTAAFSIVLTKQWDQTMTALNVTVNILCTAAFSTTNALVFRTVMVEKLINFTVQPGTNGEKVFENPAVKSFPTLQTGVPLVGTWVPGQSKTFTLNCPIPSYIDPAHNRDINQLDFVGFIQDDGNKKVAQAVRGSDCDYVTATTAYTDVCVGDQVTLTGNGGTNFTWSTGQTGASIVVSAIADSTYYAMSSDANACPNRGEISLKVNQCTSIKKTAGNSLLVDIFPNPSKGEFLVKADFSNANTHMVVYNNLGQKVLDQTLNAGETSVKTNLSKGLYTYDVLQDNKKVSNGKLIIE